MTAVAPDLCRRRCSLTVNHALITEANDYAVLFTGSGNSGFGVRLPDSLFEQCQSDGGDVCFAANADGTGRLPVQRVAIDTAAKTCEIWVCVPLVTSSDVAIWVFWQSKAGTLTQPEDSDTYGRNAAWGSDYAAVWNFGTESSLDLTDSTGNGNDGTNTGVTAAAGRLSGAGSFDASARIAVGTGVSVAGPITIAAWIKPTNLNNYRCIVCKGPADDNRDFALFLAAGDPNAVYCSIGGGTSPGFIDLSTPISAGAWNHLALVATGSAIIIYLNGVEVGRATSTRVPLGGAYPTVIGNEGTAGPRYPMLGLIDDLRIASSARSAAYMATDYAIQTANNLITVGTPERNGGVPASLLQPIMVA